MTDGSFDAGGWSAGNRTASSVAVLPYDLSRRKYVVSSAMAGDTSGTVPQRIHIYAVGSGLESVTLLTSPAALGHVDWLDMMGARCDGSLRPTARNILASTSASVIERAVSHASPTDAARFR